MCHTKSQIQFFFDCLGKKENSTKNVWHHSLLWCRVSIIHAPYDLYGRAPRRCCLMMKTTMMMTAKVAMALAVLSPDLARPCQAWVARSCSSHVTHRQFLEAPRTGPCLPPSPSLPLPRGRRRGREPSQGAGGALQSSKDSSTANGVPSSSSPFPPPPPPAGAVRYRTARESDLPAIAELLASSFASTSSGDGTETTTATTGPALADSGKNLYHIEQEQQQQQPRPPSPAAGTDTTSSSSSSSRQEFEEQLRRRMATSQGQDGPATAATTPHAWIVATAAVRIDDKGEEDSTAAAATTTTTTEGSSTGPMLESTPPVPERQQQQHDRIIGFMEIGTMPSPILAPPLQQQQQQQQRRWQDRLLLFPNGGATNSNNNAPSSSSTSQSVRPVLGEMPYLANVAVSTEYRRRGIGSTLVQLATKIATKWTTTAAGNGSSNYAIPTGQRQAPPFLFLSVEEDNRSAVSFYEQLGFTPIPTAINKAQNNNNNNKQHQKTKKIYLQKHL
jgi:ribosomal protein S18 acetylase RimI-like enzyme